MSTIKDVAREAGVSIATVSRVINQSRPVKAEAREQVMKALKKLDYQPNIAARNLVKKRETHPSICVLFPEVISSFFSEVIKGLRDALKEKKYNLLVFDRSSNYKEMVPTLALEGNPGVIVLCRNLPEEEKQMLEAHRIDWILVDSYHSDAHCVYVDHLYGGRLAADYLLGKGCQHPLIISETISPEMEHWARIRGFQNRWKIRKGKGVELLQVDTAKSPREYMERGYEATLQALEMNRYDGIFYFCDELAYGGAAAQREKNTQLPMVGYDGFDATLFHGLPTVAQPMSELGYAAGLMMVDLLERKEKIQGLIQRAFRPELLKP